MLLPYHVFRDVFIDVFSDMYIDVFRDMHIDAFRGNIHIDVHKGAVNR